VVSLHSFPFTLRFFDIFPPGFQSQPSKSGNHTPKAVNSLAAIAGNEGDEEPWKYASYNAEEDEVNLQRMSTFIQN